MEQKQKLFVCGCPRSGTSAVADWLSKSPKFAIGMERYQGYWHKNNCFPENAFTEARFFDMTPGDTWYDSLSQFAEFYGKLTQNWQKASYVGDEIPGIWRNFQGVFSSFPQAKILYVYRDPFSVARSYKIRAQNQNDKTWGRHRDVTFAIIEWNESVRKVVDFFNSEPQSRHSKHDQVHIIEYEKFVTNSFDRRALATFLGLSDPLPLVANADLHSSSNIQQSPLSETEKDLIWSQLDLSLVSEIKKILGCQLIELGIISAPSNKSGRREWYHREDKQLASIDYGEYKIPGCSFLFRGRDVHFEATSDYVACIGSATTFGRFIKNPYPAQLEKILNRPVINLGISGARPECYLTNVALLDFLRSAQLVIIELMSARGYPFSLFAPTSHEGNMGIFMDWFNLKEHRSTDPRLDWLLNKADAGEPVFIDRVYEICFPYLSSKQRDLIRDQVINQYLRDFTLLAKEINRPVVGLLMTRSQPYAARGLYAPDNYPAWSGEYPHFVDGLVAQYLEQQGIPVVVSRSDRGFPFVVRNWETGHPASVFPWQKDPSINTYYPSQEMHDDSTRLLCKSKPIIDLQYKIINPAIK